MPPKRSRGKPALSRVPFLEGVNGDSDYNGSGEEQCSGGAGGTGPPKEPALQAAALLGLRTDSRSLSYPKPRTLGKEMALILRSFVFLVLCF